MRQPNGYAPIEEYALIGDGRTAALAALDGSIDWLCLPNFDSPPVFAAVLDSEIGGQFQLKPTIPFKASRRYVPKTNVLETTFETDRGSVRVVDAMVLPDAVLSPVRELARVVEGLSGDVPMMWTFSPRFDYGRPGRYERRGGVPVATSGSTAVAAISWDAGRPEWSGGVARSEFVAAQAKRSTIVLASAHGEPLIIPGRAAVERRLAATINYWERWSNDRQYNGPWAEHVLRSALVLKALVFAPSGASVAAPTTSLPEEIGGERNWDYRFCWIRDSNFAIDALLNLGCYDEAQSLFWWFMQATALTEPRLHVLYKLDGGIGGRERQLPLSGYLQSRPVRAGNGAIEQQQHDIYGCLFETARLYSDGHHPIDSEVGEVLAGIADHVCGIWREPDSGIWEVRTAPAHFTHSKVMCWVALDRAIQLAERGELPKHRLSAWKSEAASIRHYVDTQCWSNRLSSYTRVAGQDDVDASLLMLAMLHYHDPTDRRLSGTIDAVIARLGAGDFVYRYHADDGLSGKEGCFTNCAFWLVAALARNGRVAEATTRMERLVAMCNDVGLYAEEVEPTSGAFLGNFPQALVHLALIDAAIAIRDATQS